MSILRNMASAKQSAKEADAKRLRVEAAAARKRMDLGTRLSNQANSVAMMGPTYVIVNAGKDYVATRVHSVTERARELVLKELGIDINAVPFLTLQPNNTKLTLQHFSVASKP